MTVWACKCRSWQTTSPNGWNQRASILFGLLAASGMKSVRVEFLFSLLKPQKLGVWLAGFLLCLGQLWSSIGTLNLTIFFLGQVHLPDDHNGQSWIRPKPELGALCGSPIWVVGAQKLSIVFCYFPRPLAGSWFSQDTVAYVGYRCPRQQLNPVVLQCQPFIMKLFSNIWFHMLEDMHAFHIT